MCVCTVTESYEMTFKIVIMMVSRWYNCKDLLLSYPRFEMSVGAWMKCRK